MSRLRLAYGMNDPEAQIVMSKLWPHALFPLELWRKAYELFWSGFANSAVLIYSITIPEFPKLTSEEKKYFYSHLYAQDMEKLFSMLASRIHANSLLEGFKYILSMTYENIDEIVFKDNMDFLFESLSTIEKNIDFEFAQRLPKEKFNALMEDKIFGIPPSGYFFISKMYSETILVDTVSAIRNLHLLNLPFKKEVKGITHALVNSVINSLKEEEEAAQNEAEAVTFNPESPDEPAAPPSTGSRKDIERIKATHQICEVLMEELSQERKTFEESKHTWTPYMLYSNGKTNWDTFFKAAMTRLDRQPHRAAAREIWKKIPGNLKHNGRMPDQ